MDPKALVAALFELAPTRDPRAALELGAAEWPGIAAREANAEDAESCRLLAISAAEVGEHAVAFDWRRRALLRGAQIGWTEMVAAIVMSEAFIALSRKNDDYARGRTLDVIEGEPAAVRIMADLAPFAVEPGSGIRATEKSPSPALIRRFVVEKRGSFQVALGEWDAAIDSFTQAITDAEAERGRLKARAGLALARYGAALAAGRDGDAEALAETTAIIAEAGAAGEDDLAKTATHNAEVMARGGRDLLLYEIL